MCRLLHLLTDPAHSRASLFLLGQDGHHGLGEQVSVLSVTHHLLQAGSDGGRRQSQDMSHNKMQAKLKLASGYASIRQILLR